MTAQSFSKEMGVSHADFFRLLPRAMGDVPFVVDGKKVTAEFPEGSLMITIGEEQVRRIALMTIPFAEVSFAFDGVEEHARSEFMKYFDLRFQRGGG